MSSSPTNKPPKDDEPGEYRPSDRFWPYVDVPEAPSDDELALLDPDLRRALSGDDTDRPFSVTLVFPVFGGENFDRAIELAQTATEYRITGAGAAQRHRARFLPPQAVDLRALFELVGPVESCEVRIDDRAIPYARELWLPLIWFLIHLERLRST